MQIPSYCFAPALRPHAEAEEIQLDMERLIQDDPGVSDLALSSGVSLLAWMRAMCADRVDPLIVRLDRLGRSLHKLLEVVDLLKERRIHFQSLEEKIDASSAAGELIFHVFGAIAHFERRLIGERTKDGLAAAKAQGAQARSTTRQSRQARCSLEADRSRPIADPSCATGRTRTRHYKFWARKAQSAEGFSSPARAR